MIEEKKHYSVSTEKKIEILEIMTLTSWKREKPVNTLHLTWLDTHDTIDE